MMKAPRLPSFFRTPLPKKFDFKPRYYDSLKEKQENRRKENKKELRFERKLNGTTKSKVRVKRIIFVFIILSLFTYFILI